MPGQEAAVVAPREAVVEKTWTLAPEEELRLEIEARTHEHKCSIQVSSACTV